MIISLDAIFGTPNLDNAMHKHQDLVDLVTKHKTDLSFRYDMRMHMLAQARELDLPHLVDAYVGRSVAVDHTSKNKIPALATLYYSMASSKIVLLDYMLVMPTDKAGLISYYKDSDDRRNNKRSVMKIRKFLQRYDLLDGVDDENVARQWDNLTTPLDKWDVTIINNDDADGWREAYASVRSCMSPGSLHSVGTHAAWRCYVSRAYSNVDNGLWLVVLRLKHDIVARAICWHDGNGNKCYNKIYANGGDLRLWLERNDYKERDGLPDGTLLWSTPDKYGDYLSPYLDGDNHYANLDMIDGQPFWVIDSDGTADLQTCDAYIGEYNDDRCLCEQCGERSEYLDYATDSNGYSIGYCDACYADLTWVNRGMACEWATHDIDAECDIYEHYAPADETERYWDSEGIQHTSIILDIHGNVHWCYDSTFVECEYSGAIIPADEVKNLDDMPHDLRESWGDITSIYYQHYQDDGVPLAYINEKTRRGGDYACNNNGCLTTVTIFDEMERASVYHYLSWHINDDGTLNDDCLAEYGETEAITNYLDALKTAAKIEIKRP